MTMGAGTPLELFFDQLRDLYSMEIQLCESMPDLVTLCTNEALRDLVLTHAHQNRQHIDRVSAMFEWHDKSPGDDNCRAMAGLIEGGTAHLEAVRCPNIRDLMMIAHCLRIEYYEMAAYEFTALISGRLGLMRESGIIDELLADEKAMAAALLLLEPDLFAATS